MIGSVGGLDFLIIAMLSVLIFVWPAWRILSKAGYPGWFGVGALFPPAQVTANPGIVRSEAPTRR